MSAVIALTRPVPDSLADCELTHVARVPIDVSIARAQHSHYERMLQRLGCRIRQVAATPDLPDSVFVEDTAVVLDDVAIITRPGAESRRGETASVAAALGEWRPVQFLEPPATLDGGDVLRLGRTLYVGIGARSNRDGAAQLDAMVRPYGYEVRTARATGCLHLKSAVTELAPGLVLVNPEWIDPRDLDGHTVLEIDPGEPLAANVLRIADTIVGASSYDRTNARIRAAGLIVETVDVSELAKAEAGLTCCSVVFRDR